MRTGEAGLGYNKFTLILVSILMMIFSVWSMAGLSSEHLLRPAFAIPESFVDSKFADSLDLPTAMEFAPDGRLFVADKGGEVRVIKNGVLLPTPFLKVLVNSDANRGLIGITFDPNFATNGFVYVYYTDDSPIHNRVSRFTADPVNPDIALAGSEFPILDLETAAGHNGGAIHFGGDGKLYVAVGDNGTPSNSQTLSNRFGKILRINSDGSIPSDNPFFNTAGAKKEIWALGFRNPYTFTISAVTHKMYINDVGEATWEEVNNGTIGKNYGWPTCEGLCSPTNPAFVNPIYTYNHNGTDAAITGAIFYEANQFPPLYYGSYFFGDYAKNFIKRLSPTNVVSDFLIANSPVDIDVGPDGSLYYLSIVTGEVHKVQFLISNQFPQANVIASPISGQPPLTVNFNATNSTDPDPGTILSYLWNFGDGSSDNTSGATVSHIYNQKGPFVATLTVNDGVGGTDSKTIDISVGDPPIGIIIAPSIGTKYNAGDAIFFNGSATDAKGDSLPDTAFKWTILFHHGTHTHPFMQFNGVKNGTFTIPTLDETSSDVWYRIYLKVTDSFGLTHTSTRDVIPNKSTITLGSNIPGLQVNLDGQPKTTPFSFVGVVGIIRELQGIPFQTLGGTTYQFKSWSDGGAATHTISTPSSDTTYNVTSVPAITFDNSKNNNGALCSSTICSINLTVGSSNDRMIIVAITAEGTLHPVTSVDVTGGTSQGILVGKKQVGSSTTELNVEMWRIMESDISDGPNTITVHFAAAPSGAGISAMSFSHIKQQPEDAENSNTVLSNPAITTGITTLTDGALIVSAVGNGQGGGTYTSHGTDQTERHDFATNSAWHGVTTEIKPLAGLDNQLHTYSKTANRQAQYVASFASATGSAATPPITTASPPGGSYSTVQSVTLSTNKPATIFYTTDGSTPTVLSTVYTTPIQISTTTTLKFFAKDIDGTEESVKTLMYTITSGLPITHMSDTTASTGLNTYSGRPIHAEYVSPTSQLVGDSINSITLKLKKSGTPTGLAEIGIFNTDLSAKKLFETKDVSKLTTSYVDYTFSLSSGQTYQIQSNDRIGIKYSGGSTTNNISVMRDTVAADPFDGVNSYHTYYTTTWTSATANDLYMILRQSSP